MPTALTKSRLDLERDLETLFEQGEIDDSEYSEGLDLLSEIHDAELRFEREWA